MSKNKKTEMKNKEINPKRLIHALSQIVECEKIQLKKKITLDDWIELKIAISPVNNFITQKLTEAFINKLSSLFPGKLDSTTINELLTEYKNINVNGNGYDFVLNKTGYPKIVAEVKANIPYEGTRFGGAQKKGINKDINGLLNGKTKGNIDNLSDYYKFQIMLNYETDSYSSFDAIENFLRNKTNKGNLRLFKGGSVLKPDGKTWTTDEESLNTSNVYVLLLKCESDPVVEENE